MALVETAQVGIIGAGPAGVAAAVQLTRYGIPFVLFEKESVGGLLRNANFVENYLGFPNGIMGLSMVRQLIRHLENLDIEIVRKEAKQATWENEGWTIFTDDKTERTHYLAVATGTKPCEIDLPFEDTEAAELVFYEAFPLIDWRGRKISILGGGDAAFDYALNLSKHNNVTIHFRSERPRCLPLLYDRAVKSTNLKICPNSEIVSAKYMRPSLALNWREKGSVCFEPTDALICAVGREPVLSCLHSSTHERLEELIDEGRIYLIGDVKNGIYRQASIAAADGIRAAMQIAYRMRGELQ